MEKMNLAKNICKTVYGLRSGTIKQRMRNTAKKLDTLSGDLSKVRTDPNYVKAVSTCPNGKEEAQHVVKQFKQCAESFEKLVRDYIHFMEHEEPFNPFRNYVAPFGVAALGCLLLGAEGYRRYLNKKYLDRILVHNRHWTEKYQSALEKDLSPETAM